MELAIKKRNNETNRNKRRNCSDQRPCNARQAMRYQMFAAPSGDLLSALHVSLCWWRVPDSWCWCWICSISPWPSRTRWPLPAPSQKHTYSPAIQRYRSMEGAGRLLWALLFLQSTPLLFFFFFRLEALFYNCEWGKSVASSTSFGPSTELHGQTPQKPVIYSRILKSFILLCLTGRPRNYR